MREGVRQCHLPVQRPVHEVRSALEQPTQRSCREAPKRAKNAPTHRFDTQDRRPRSFARPGGIPGASMHNVGTVNRRVSIVENCGRRVAPLAHERKGTDVRRCRPAPTNRPLSGLPLAVPPNVNFARSRRREARPGRRQSRPCWSASPRRRGAFRTP